MKKIYALLLIAAISFSFRIFDANYFALTVNFTQDWSTTTLITTDDVWTGVPSIQGFRGDGLTAATGADPQTILGGDDAAPVLDVNANRSDPNTFGTGGVAEFDGIATPCVALSGSGTADAPYITLYLNTTGVTNIRVQYNIRDLDGSADNAVQQVALQYRTATTGSFTNIPAAFVTDATTGPNLATLVTAVNTVLPAACENQATLQLRIMTANAGGNDEWVGIDDIVITPNSPANTISVTGGGSIPEAGPAGTFTLTFSPATTVPTTIDYDLSTSTATLTTDYGITQTVGTPTTLSTATGTLTIPAATTTVTLTVTPVNDLSQELTETVAISILNPTQGYTLGSSSASANIIDDDIDPINYTGVTYTQDFNSLVATGASTVTPIGWLFAETGASANSSYTANTGGLNTGDTYSYGTDPDRAFGGLRSGSLVPTIGAKIQNNSGATLSSLTIAYRGEQWRLGSTGRNDRLDFQYSLDATSLTTGTWVNVDGLDFIGPLSSGTTGAIVGNNAPNFTNLSLTLNGLSIPSGAIFYIRWLDQDAAGADDGLSVDDFSLSPGCTPPTNQPTGLNLVPALTSISGSFTAAVAGTTPADAYLVIVSTSNTLTEQPVNGTAYAIDDVIGNGTVVAVNGSTSFPVSGLTPSTTYYFFVYSNAAATNCYNITSPLTGTIATTSPPVCTPPTTQASGLSATNITGTSMDLNYTRGNGDNILIVARTGSSVNSNPYNGVAYPAGSQIGTGNFVIYNGPAATFTYTSLAQNTSYYFALYEYSNATPCYTSSALTGNFTTSCVTPVNVTGFSPTSQNGAIALSWTNPTVSCFDEVLVIASNAPITGAGNTFVGAGNTVYGGPDQVVFRGIGTVVTITGLTNGTTYYFKIFTRNSGNYSSGVQVTASPFDPTTGFLYLYGNLHAHSSYSDGNQDNLANTPAEDFAFARDANCMDFLGISEHNHATAGMNLPDYALGYGQANAINGVPGPGGNSIVTLWGMEWGTIGTGGHMLVYGFDNQLVGWEPGNYDIFCEKGDYTSLLGLINNQPNSFASLAHPSTADYNNIAGTAYSASKDDAIVATAIESGPAFSTSVTYNDYPSSLAYLSYYRTMLAKGYRLGASMDQDNHNMTFGRANANRLVVLSPVKSRSEIVNSIRNMRFYASQDCNARVDYKINAGVIGSSVTGVGVPTITATLSDVDGENAATIELWGGAVGGTVPVAAIKTYSGANTFTFDNSTAENVQPDNSTYYYYLIVTQDDGNKIVTSPIWFSRSDLVLPITLINFKAVYNSVTKTGLLTWSTAQEINSLSFEIERSTDGGLTWTTLGSIAAAGTSNSFTQYQFTDLNPVEGTNRYRLRQIDQDGKFTLTKIVSIAIRSKTEVYFTLYPNPTSGFTYIYSNVTKPTKATIQLVDINGRVSRQLQTNIVNATPVKFELGGISAGIYFIKISYDDKVTVQKLIVK
jgi:trimeric autotransporter adhesin